MRVGRLFSVIDANWQHQWQFVIARFEMVSHQPDTALQQIKSRVLRGRGKMLEQEQNGKIAILSVDLTAVNDVAVHLLEFWQRQAFIG